MPRKVNLSKEDEQKILQSYAKTKASELARRYGCCASYIRKLVYNAGQRKAAPKVPKRITRQEGYWNDQDHSKSFLF